MTLRKNSDFSSYLCSTCWASLFLTFAKKINMAHFSQNVAWPHGKSTAFWTRKGIFDHDWFFFFTNRVRIRIRILIFMFLGTVLFLSSWALFFFFLLDFLLDASDTSRFWSTSSMLYSWSSVTVTFTTFLLSFRTFLAFLRCFRSINLDLRIVSFTIPGHWMLGPRPMGSSDSLNKPLFQMNVTMCHEWWKIKILFSRVNEWLKKWKWNLYFEPRVAHWHYAIC